MSDYCDSVRFVNLGFEYRECIKGFHNLAVPLSAKVPLCTIRMPRRMVLKTKCIKKKEIKEKIYTINRNKEFNKALEESEIKKKMI